MIADRYTLLREVGRGGMGAVWQGEDVLLGRSVAMKRIGFAPESPLDANGVGAPDQVRAEREARLAAMINHPHVVSVYDLVEAEDRQWLVMEYVDGTALSALLEAEGPLPEARAAALTAQAADALAAAHEAGVVHRDVKPSNILVTTDDQVKLTDFGIARGESDASLTRTGMVTGSPAYLAPEVASGAMATTASDVWSLGATLYHALSGRTPYAVGDNVLGTLYRIVNEEPPRLDPRNRLAPLLEHTMATDPALRWTMTQVRDFLRGAGAPAGPAEETQAMAAPLPSFFDGPAPEAAAPGPTGADRSTSSRTTRTASHARPRDRSRLLPAVVVLLAVALVALLGVGLFVLIGDDDGDRAAAPTSDTAPATEPEGSPSESTTEPPAEPVATQMTSFVEGYLADVTSDPTATWEQLTPAFQDASGGYGTYSGFWSSYASATPRDVQADPEALTVSYTVDYVLEDGSEETDQVTLQLEYDDGQYRIAGET